MNISPYLDLNSVIHNLNYKIKFIGYLILLILSIYNVSILITIFIFILIKISKIPFTLFFKNKLLLILPTMIFIINILLAGDAIYNTLKIFNLLIISSLFLKIITQIEIRDAIYYFTRNKKLSFIITLTFQFIPIIKYEYDNIIKAQKVRKVKITYISILIPLLHKVNERIHAMDNSLNIRGYKL